MKKLASCIILLFCFLLGGNKIYANGAIIGKAVKTDITAYIDGVPIPSYNINGFTGIIAEDLENYDFDVHYDAENRKLNIYYGDGSYISANDMPFIEHTEKQIDNNYQITSALEGFAFPLYQTNIVTSVEGKVVPAYNIGGRTIILMDALKEYGTVTWHPEERKICFKPEFAWAMRFSDEESVFDENAQIHNFTIEVNRNEQGGFDISGENIQYLSDPVMEVSYREKTFSLRFDLYMDDPKPMQNIHEIRTILKENADIANQYFDIFINGEKAEITSVVEFYGGNHGGYIIYFADKFVSLKDFYSMKVVCKW